MQADDMKRHLAETYGISEDGFERLMEEFLAYFGSTLEQYVRSRHLELQRTGKKNPEIYRTIAAEACTRRFAVGELSERRVRRLIYG
jgi:hypothetical protein